MIRAAARRFLRRSDGAAALEFALIAPVALILLAGLVNVGLQVREQAQLDQATREVVEAAMVSRDITVLEGLLARSLAEHGITPSQAPAVDLVCLCPGQNDIPRCTISDARLCAATGLPWEIVIEIRAQTLYRPLIGGAGITLDSRMRVQVR